MKVYATYRNSDTTEGRGPMVMDAVFLHERHAIEHIDEQPGVQGRRFKWSQEQYGDWQVKEITVIESSVIDHKKRQLELIRLAREKLTVEELAALLGTTGYKE